MIKELNDLALEIQTNPHILIDDMSYEEFGEWVSNDGIIVLENLLELLIEYEMYEHCVIVHKKIQNL